VSHCSFFFFFFLLFLLFLLLLPVFSSSPACRGYNELLVNVAEGRVAEEEYIRGGKNEVDR